MLDVTGSRKIVTHGVDHRPAQASDGTVQTSHASAADHIRRTGKADHTCQSGATVTRRRDTITGEQQLRPSLSDTTQMRLLGFGTVTKLNWRTHTRSEWNERGPENSHA